MVNIIISFKAILPGEHVESSLAHVVGDDARERSKAGYTETIDFIMSNSDCVLYV